MVAGSWPGITWQQCVLGTKLPRRLKKGAHMWSLFRGSVLWITWLDRNATCFSNAPRPAQKLEKAIWEAFLDHARAAWVTTSNLCQLYLDKAARFLQKFDSTWLSSKFLGTRAQRVIHWHLVHPKMGVFS